jgi:hypothetical protein
MKADEYESLRDRVEALERSNGLSPSPCAKATHTPGLEGSAETS